MRIVVQTPEEPAYKPLRTSFRSKGFDYVQKVRIGDVALFEQSKPGLSRTWFEVVLVQRHGDYEIGGAKVEAAETMPGSSQWGRLGWTYRDPKEARSRFDKLVKREKDKPS
jgi:hypothetical protein